MNTVSPRRMLRRREAAKYLRETWGVPCAEKTLAKLAVVGGGPPYRVYGRIPLYEPDQLDGWVRSKLSIPIASTSDIRTTSPIRRQSTAK
jgi:hypothetical protein